MTDTRNAIANIKAAAMIGANYGNPTAKMALAEIYLLECEDALDRASNLYNDIYASSAPAEIRDEAHENIKAGSWLGGAAANIMTADEIIAKYGNWSESFGVKGERK